MARKHRSTDKKTAARGSGRILAAPNEWGSTTKKWTTNTLIRSLKFSNWTHTFGRSIWERVIIWSCQLKCGWSIIGAKSGENDTHRSLRKLNKPFFFPIWTKKLPPRKIPHVKMEEWTGRNFLTAPVVHGICSIRPT